MGDEVDVRDGSVVGVVSPLIYGQFVEHLGRAIYGGLWVGDSAAVETVGGGVRADTVSLLRALPTPVVRWPGGCFADTYHWEDGVGPRDRRPRRPNHVWLQGREYVDEESNAFGTDEFVRLCRLLDAEPYLTVNVGTGSPREALNWVEYCNRDGGTEYAARRSANGCERPHDVTYWGIGNESWGCGGGFDAAEYATEYRRFVTFVDAFDATDFMDESRTIELVACGHTDRSWNRTLLDHVGDRDLVDHLSFHRFFGGVTCGGATEFTRDEYYRLFAEAGRVADDVDRMAATIESSAADDVGVVVDEWGAWHPRTKHHNGLEQENTVRDALAAASVLNALNERADVVSMANLAQAVNVLQCLVQTDETAAWPTPTYRVFELYDRHVGATALRATVDTDVRDVPDADGVPLVTASASRRDGATYVTVVNRSFDERRTVRVDAPCEGVEEATAAVLFDGMRPAARSARGTRGEFESEPMPVAVEAGAAVVELPACSVAGIEVRA